MDSFLPVFLNITNSSPMLKPLYGVEPFPSSEWVLVVVFFVVLCLVIGAFFFLQRYLCQKKEVEQPLSWIIAYAKINELLKNNLIENKQYEVFVTELSQIIRQYIEDRFLINAPDMTTEEFLAHIGRISKPPMGEGDLALLQGFMQECDQVKFAKYDPTPELMKKLVDSAGEFIKESEIDV